MLEVCHIPQSSVNINKELTTDFAIFASNRLSALFLIIVPRETLIVRVGVLDLRYAGALDRKILL